MTLTLTQTCDGCGATRELESMTEEHAGWRVVESGKPKKHLCTDCIRRALGRTEPANVHPETEPK